MGQPCSSFKHYWDVIDDKSKRVITFALDGSNSRIGRVF